VKRTSTSDQRDTNTHAAPVAGELERGCAAYARRAWDDAFQLLSLADQSSPLVVEDLERFAWSAALSGRDEDLLTLLERLYNESLAVGECVRAARAAFWLGLRLFAIGEPARAGGWLARSQRLVEREDTECVEKGYLLLPAVFRALAVGDFQSAQAMAADAAAIGERFADADLISLARTLQGRALIGQERIAEGLSLLDEAMVATTTGELSPLVTGMIYCTVISSCQKVFALDRAREWTAALSKWCDAQPQLATFTSSCLIHRSEIMQLNGAWHEAIEEARRASGRFTQSIDRETTANAHYQQAEIHRLRGEFSAAEEAYASASQFGRDPQPGLALLRVAQGRCDAAATAIRRALSATNQRLARIRLLPAYVEIMLAVGSFDEAREACKELDESARSLDIEVLAAMAAHARGALQLSEGDAQAALGPLRHAFMIWQQAGAPYIAARVRVLVGLACRALGDEDGTALEFSAARSVFEQLGAAPDLARIDSLVKRVPPADCHGLTPRELEVLRLVAAGKTNKAIAKDLCLSEKTIDRHVSNIFIKINVASRAAATAYAYENELI
jgi:DNA-binding NarL/FixJ family response regulator